MKILRALKGDTVATVEIRATLISKVIWALVISTIAWTFVIEAWVWFWVTVGVFVVLAIMNVKYWLVKYAVCKNRDLVLEHQESTSNVLGISTLILTIKLRGEIDA